MVNLFSFSHSHLDPYVSRQGQYWWYFGAILVYMTLCQVFSIILEFMNTYDSANYIIRLWTLCYVVAVIVFQSTSHNSHGPCKARTDMLVICSVHMYAYDIRKHMTWYLKAEHLAELPILSRLRRNWSFLVLYPVSSTWSFAQCPPQSQLLSCLRRWRGAADDLVWADRGAPARWRSSTPRARRTRTPYRWTSRRRSPWCTTPCNKCVKTTPQTHTCHRSISAAEHAGRWGIGSIFRKNRATSAMDKNLDLGADKLGSCT